MPPKKTYNRHRRFSDRIPASLLVLWRWIFRASIASFILGLAIVLFYYLLSLDFDLKQVGGAPNQIEVLDLEGKKINGFQASKYPPAKFEDLPPALIDSLLAREDEHFFEHIGFDPIGLCRATLRNLKDRSFTQGASTITMQLARNSYPNMKAKSIHRKLLEIALTLRIESHYSKQEIIAHYLNRIYFGSGSHGIQEASHTYFGLPPNELNQGECALLAGIIRGPHIFSPFNNYEAALAQRNEVLNRLVASQKIPSTDLERIKQLPIRLITKEKRESKHSYPSQWIERELDQILSAQDIRDDGLKVQTSISQVAQQELETRLAKALFDLEKNKSWKHPKRNAETNSGYLQCAAVLIEIETGKLRALVGGRDPEINRLNRVINGYRDFGEAFIPIVNAAAAERGKLIISGQPITTGRQVGPDEIARIAARLGIDCKRQDEDLLRGSVAGRPDQLAIALATLFAKGKRPDLSCVQSIETHQGETLFKREVEAHPSLTQAATERVLSSPPFKKRGKSYAMVAFSLNKRDCWILTRRDGRLLELVWLGFDDKSPIEESPVLLRCIEQIQSNL